MADFLKNKLANYRKQGKVKLVTPQSGRQERVDILHYSGPHTGIGEATPTGKYIVQFLEHIGFPVIDEWYVLSESHGWEEDNIKSKMGDIRGKPTEEELLKIKEDPEKIANLR